MGFPAVCSLQKKSTVGGCCIRKSEVVTKPGKKACSEYLKRDNLNLKCIFANYSGPKDQNLLVVAFVQEKTMHLNITS